MSVVEDESSHQYVQAASDSPCPEHEDTCSCVIKTPAEPGFPFNIITTGHGEQVRDIPRNRFMTLSWFCTYLYRNGVFLSRSSWNSCVANQKY